MTVALRIRCGDELRTQDVIVRWMESAGPFGYNGFHVGIQHGDKHASMIVDLFDVMYVPGGVRAVIADRLRRLDAAWHFAADAIESTKFEVLPLRQRDAT